VTRAPGAGGRARALALLGISLLAPPGARAADPADAAAADTARRAMVDTTAAVPRFALPGLSDSTMRALADTLARALPDSAWPAPADPAAPAPAADPAAPADTTIHQFLEILADSTDRYFGLSAAVPDTTGLDSLLMYALAHPRDVRRLPFTFYPDFNFNRVDGPVWGAGVAGGHSRRGGRIGLQIGYAEGPEAWRFRGQFQKTWERRTMDWTLRVEAGRETNVLDPDRRESNLAMLRALISGRDRRHYLWREGVEVDFNAGTALWRLGAGYREQQEKPLATTTTWNLLRHGLSIVENFPAAEGTVREFELSATWLLPFVPITLEGVGHVSSDALGSDFDYRRMRLSSSAKFGIGRHATVIPQIAYGRVYGDLVPQAALYLGGSKSLRSVSGSSIGGAGLTLARIDLIGAADLLALARVPHPAMFPIQGGLFVGTGAVWGDDPYGGPTRPGSEWPERELWLSEAGVSLFYQPGVPDPSGFVRLSYAVPLGPERDDVSRFTVAYTRALDLVRPFGR